MSKLCTYQSFCCFQPGNSNDWFLGKHLLPLLRLVLCLPQGPETDLLQNLDRWALFNKLQHYIWLLLLLSFDMTKPLSVLNRIMESLNLLRYMLIRDKEWENEVIYKNYLLMFILYLYLYLYIVKYKNIPNIPKQLNRWIDEMYLKFWKIGFVF